MADKKISALPAATTPLAGTEVLPVVQGGATDQVSVANLTAGRAVNALSVTTTQDVTTGRNLVVTGAGRVEQNGAAGGLYFINTAVSAGATNMRFYTTNAAGAAQLQLGMYGGATPINDIYGDLTAATGNFKIGVAGKGIDFSANTNAPGMTSELLTWYEEGTWTPTQGAGLTVVGAFSSSGTYTRIGRLVFVRGVLNGATSVAWNASAAIICGGLPFPAAATATGLAYNQAFTAITGIVPDVSDVRSAEAMGATPQAIFTATYMV